MIHTTPNANDAHEPLVRLERLDVRFGRNRVLRDINLEVAHGETLAVIGESGCGKTVLLKTMIGLLRPTEGAVYFDGRNLAVFDSMTVAQNVGFPLRQHTSKTGRHIREIVLARLAEVGLSQNIADSKPAELSGGMRKRVGLARALVMEPELMLYDEPTTGLDPIMGDVINELMIATRARHPVTSIIVTHDMRTARKVADRVVMLFPSSRLAEHEGQILHDGPANQIDSATDPRVSQFVRGEARERLMEMRQQNGS
jgi:phospholipid/cholesterol/gamma-HCH transport system ATP-binding protein